MHDHISQFEPLLPSEGKLNPALEKAHELLRLAPHASGRAAPDIMSTIAPLLRKMNSYYTNRIEGQHTLPAEIDQALKRQFSADPDTQRRQRMALAHIEAEAWAEQHYGWQSNWNTLLDSDAIADLHRALFSFLPTVDLMDEHGAVIVPGEFRSGEVRVGRHVAPSAQSVPLFLQRFKQVYAGVRKGELAAVAVAAMHHRLAWIHPFSDGNGRVARLHSHMLLFSMQLSNGVWSPLRGLARTQQRYYELLANADMPRQGDLDGRGNLSESMLLAFIDYFLDICIDQVRFMTEMLNLSSIKDRIAACLAYETTRAGSAIKLEALEPLHYIFSAGEIERGMFKRMTGLPSRQADRCVKELLHRGLLISDTPKGAVRFGIPLHALRFYFPALWPEAEMDAATARQL